MRHVRIKSDRIGLARTKVHAALGRAVRKVALAIEGNAAANAPVDTGALSASIYTETSDGSGRDAAISAAASKGGESFEPIGAQVASIGDTEARVGVAAHYGTYVELGTVKSAAQPFLGPAADQVEAEIDNIVAAEIKKVLD